MRLAGPHSQPSPTTPAQPFRAPWCKEVKRIFTVDRLIDLQLTQQNSPLTVAPGTTTARLEYLLVNEGNDNQAYSFSIADVAGDDFDDSSYVVEYFVDTNANS